MIKNLKNLWTARMTVMIILLFVSFVFLCLAAPWKAALIFYKSLSIVYGAVLGCVVFAGAFYLIRLPTFLTKKERDFKGFVSNAWDYEIDRSPLFMMACAVKTAIVVTCMWIMCFGVG